MSTDQNMICPKCGTFQKKKEICEKCGIVVDKFKSIEQEKTQTGTKPVEKSTGSKPDIRRVSIPIRIPAILIIVAVIAAAIYGLPRLSGEKDFDKYMQDIPIFNVIKENDQAAYENLKTLLRNSIRHRETKSQIIARVQEFSANLVKKYVPRASDDSVDDYAHNLLDLMENAKSTSSELCYNLLYPKRYSQPGVLEYIQKNFDESYLDSIGRVIKTAVQNPQPQPDPKRSQELLNTLIEPVTNKYGDDLRLFGKTTHNTSEKKKMCTMSIDIYKRILLLKKEHASMVMRYLIAQG